MVETQPATSTIVQFGVFELDLRSGELRKSGMRVALQGQPLQVLTMLLERPGELVTREELRQRLWPGDTFVDFDQGLNAAVKRLRIVLGDSADVPRFIETLPRRGYRWAHAAPSGVEGPPSARRFPTTGLALSAALLALGGTVLLSRRASLPGSDEALGLRAVPLAKLSGAEPDPAISPDGRSVAFCREIEGEPGLYVMDIGTGRQSRIADDAGVASPAWSPDGREIAFLRPSNGEEGRDEIVVVPVAGGSGRRLGTVLSSHQGLDWSPDGRLLAFVDKVAANGPDAIHLLTIATGERRRLTTPVETSSPIAGDYAPSFSPEGRSVAFIRRVGTAPTSTGVSVHDIGANESRSVASGYGVRDLAWTADGRSIVFVSGSARRGTLWIVDGGGGRPRRLREKVGTISFARASRTLSFEQRVVDNNVWRASGPASPGKEPPRALSRSPRSDMQPDYSPDGRRLALAAAGPSGLGVRLCGADGADCVDFESEDNLATPQWSPDGRSLAAVGWQGERPLDVYRLEVEGRFVRRLTTDGAVDTMPTWSRDGRWLYFVSDRSGAFELWKMPSTGGEARQLTHGGAGRAYETSDGRSVYFTNGVGFGSLWRMPAEGGVGTLVLDQRIHHARWTLWRDRVVYVDEPGAGGPHRVAMFDPASRRDTTLASLDRPSASGIAVSPDGAWILYAQTDRVTSDILTLEGLW